MREWDPIGVAHAPQAADEYDSYVAEAYVMLMDHGADADQICAYLFHIASEHMGLSSIPGLHSRCARVANSLVAMKSDFLAH